MARIITKKTSSGKASVGRSSKQRKETSGSFGQQARRDGEGRGSKPKVDRAGREGEVTLEGVTEKQKTEILNLIRNTASTGPRDMNEQVSEIGMGKTSIIIRTTGEELAVSIGKRVHHSHKGGKLHITWSGNDVPVRVHWTAKETVAAGKKK